MSTRVFRDERPSVAKYNYDAYKLPSETKFCGYGSHRVAYLDGKLRYLIMLLFVTCAWLSTSVIVINQSKGNYRCSQKIIDEDHYETVKGYCSGRVSSLDGEFKEKLPEGIDASISDVPLVVAVTGKTNLRISWTIRDPDTKTIYPNKAYGNTTLIRGTGKFVDGVYLYYTCLPRNRQLEVEQEKPIQSCLGASRESASSKVEYQLMGGQRRWRYV